MKSAFVLALAGAAAVQAQSFPDNFPECGRVCGTNMYNKAGEFNCGAGDVKCMCQNANFGYGIRDCAYQSCGNNNDALTVATWGRSLCDNAGVTNAVPTGPPGASAPSPSVVGSPGAEPSVGTVVFTITTDGSTSLVTSLTTFAPADASTGATSGEVVPTPVSTGTITQLITSGSVVQTSIVETTILGVNGTPVSDVPSVSETVITSEIVSTFTSGSVIGSTTLSTTFTSAVATESTDGQDSAPSSSSQGAGAQATAAPFAGLLAAAGIAAVLL